MTRSSPQRGLSVALASAALAAATQAQGLPLGPPSASTSYVAIAGGVSHTGGDSSSPSYRTRVASDALVGHDDAVASPGYRLRGGPLWTRFAPGDGPPVLVTALPDVGPAAGGQEIDLIALNHTPAGASAPLVLFGTAPAPSVQTVPGSDIALRAVVPSGIDGICNPLGFVSVQVFQPASGGSQLPMGYAHGPALAHLGDALSGGSLELLVRAEAPFVAFLAYSSPFDFFSIVPELGCLELGPDFALLGPPLDGGDGTAEYQQLLPDGIAGLSVDVQAFTLFFLGGGSDAFTNDVRVDFQ